MKVPPEETSRVKLIFVGEKLMVLTIVLTAAAVIAALDQLIKYFIVENLAHSGAVTVIDNLLSLVYVENRGVAFGMFQNHIWIFAVITFLLIGVFIWLILSEKLTGKLFFVSAALMIGGGIGNLIDRLFRGFVVDYLSLSFFPPVCNFADYCITIGAVLFVAVLLIQGGDKEKKQKAPAEGSTAEKTSEQTEESAEENESKSEQEEKPFAGKEEEMQDKAEVDSNGD